MILKEGLYVNKALDCSHKLQDEITQLAKDKIIS